MKTKLFTIIAVIAILVSGCAGVKPAATPVPTHSCPAKVGMEYLGYDPKVGCEYQLVDVNAATGSAATVAPVANATAVPAGNSGGAETFTYVPGGANYAWPQAGAVEDVGNGWTRIRQDANGQYNTWTFFARVACDREIGNRLQWDSSTRLNVYGPISCKIEIKRDLDSSKSIVPDPYTVANAKASPLGLGWFIYGQGDITVNGSPMTLDGPGVKQMAFPKNWTGTWVITANVPANGLVILLQGEKITTPDTWPLP